MPHACSARMPPNIICKLGTFFPLFSFEVSLSSLVNLREFVVRFLTSFCLSKPAHFSHISFAGREKKFQKRVFFKKNLFVVDARVCRTRNYARISHPRFTWVGGGYAHVNLFWTFFQNSTPRKDMLRAGILGNSPRQKKSKNAAFATLIFTPFAFSPREERKKMFDL